MESVADFQRVRFNRRKDADKPKFLNYGLWRYSRHPNYFGEITVWVGIWLSSSYGLWGIDTAYGVLGLFSPLLTFVLLAFITGIPRAEKRDDERYQQYEEYHEYKKQTSPLWPFPTSLYKHMPMVLRKVPFIDIRDYTKLTKEPAPDAINEATGIPAPREPNLQANQ